MIGLSATIALVGLQLPVYAQIALTRIDIGRQADAPPPRFEVKPAGEGQPAPWTVVADKTATSGYAIEVAGGGDQSMAIYKPANVKNADISLRLKALRGGDDQIGGLALRVSAPDSYYLVQLDSSRDRVLLLRVANGASEEIVGVDADLAAESWHKLDVRAVDDQFVVTLDGQWMFTGFDKALSQAGRIALWTGNDSATRFDSMVIAPIPPAEQE
jgi:hypothetical protein